MLRPANHLRLCTGAFFRGYKLAIEQHPAASHHLPHFITAPGESDTLFAFMTLFVICAVLGLGVLFFRLHSLPERMGHKKLQFEIVAVLGLLSLFTHVHAFWVAGLLLALIDLPDFTSPLKRMAAAMEKQAGIEHPPEPQPELQSQIKLEHQSISAPGVASRSVPSHTPAALPILQTEPGE
jgi:hypothetical protein